MSPDDAPVLEQLRRLLPLASLEAGHLEELLGHCRLQHLPRGARSSLEPGPGGCLYLVAGEMLLAYPDGSNEVLVGSCGKARWPLGAAAAHPGGGLAITDLTLIRVEAPALDQLLTWSQFPPGVVADEQPAPRQIPPALLTRGPFARLPAAHIQALLAAFQPRAVKAGEVLIREGEEGDAYYLIESGRVEVVRQVGGSELPVAELGPGQSFGEEALVSGERRNASVRMKSDGRLLCLAQPEFAALLKAPLLQAVGLEQARQLVAQGACWLDVRYPVEYARDGLRGALNIPLNEIRNAFPLLSRQRPYVVYCRAGRRSAAAAFLLAQQGFDARWLEGGLPLDTAV